MSDPAEGLEPPPLSRHERLRAEVNRAHSTTAGEQWPWFTPSTVGGLLNDIDALTARLAESEQQQPWPEGSAEHERETEGTEGLEPPPPSDFDSERYTRSVTEGVAQAIRLSTIRERLGSGELIPALLAAQTSGQAWEDISDTAKEMWLHDAKWALEASGTIDLMVAYQESETRRNRLAEQLASLTAQVEKLQGENEHLKKYAKDCATALLMSPAAQDRDAAEAKVEKLQRERDEANENNIHLREALVSAEKDNERWSAELDEWESKDYVRRLFAAEAELARYRAAERQNEELRAALELITKIDWRGPEPEQRRIARTALTSTSAALSSPEREKT